MSNEAEYAVVRLAQCWMLEHEPDEWVEDYCDGAENRGCEGCIGGGRGRRVVAGSAIPVERAWPEDSQMWVEVES